MRNLYYKELKLALHPTTYLFVVFGAMLLIPNYSYYVAFFYVSLGMFFICQSGRENKDIPFTVMLPVRKRDIVTARMLLAVTVELLQLLLAVPFALLRQRMPVGPNAAGLDANIALFGSALVLFGLFNLVFFTRYYKAPDKVGRAFVWGSIAVAVYVVLAEACVHTVPWVKNVLDTPDPQHLGAKLAVLAAGAAVWAVLTLLTWKRAQKSFEALDL